MGENLSAYNVVYETGKSRWNILQEVTLLRYPTSPVRIKEKIWIAFIPWNYHYKAILSQMIVKMSQTQLVHV
jgi:hypothetical protein